LTFVSDEFTRLLPGLLASVVCAIVGGT